MTKRTIMKTNRMKLQPAGVEVAQVASFAPFVNETATRDF
jgi:hypothetical protein